METKELPVDGPNGRSENSRRCSRRCFWPRQKRPATLNGGGRVLQPPHGRPESQGNYEAIYNGALSSRRVFFSSLFRSLFLRRLDSILSRWNYIIRSRSYVWPNAGQSSILSTSDGFLLRRLAERMELSESDKNAPYAV